MRVNEQVIGDVCTVQSETLDVMHKVQQSLKTMTATFVYLKTDMIGAMRELSK